MIHRVQQDESRHAAFGSACRCGGSFGKRAAEEMHDMEDWAFSVLEALNANQNRDLLQVFEGKYGFDADDVVQMFTALPEFVEVNSA